MLISPFVYIAAENLNMGNSDDALVGRILDGEKNAFGLFFDKYADRIFGIALRYVHDRREAMDVVQEVFLKAYQSLGEIRNARYCGRWLTRIAIHTSINHRRKRLNEPIAVGDAIELVLSSSAPPEDKSSSLLSNRRVWAAIGGLIDEHKAVIILKFVDGLSYVEMAQKLNVSVSTIRSRLFYAKTHLKSALAEKISRATNKTCKRSKSASA